MSGIVDRMRKAFLKKLAEINPDLEVPPALILHNDPWLAALEALREPTEDMVDAAVGSLNSYDVGSSEVDLVWREMIDEARKP